jgi:hypothetical protein
VDGLLLVVALLLVLVLGHGAGHGLELGEGNPGVSILLVRVVVDGLLLVVLFLVLRTDRGGK